MDKSTLKKSKVVAILRGILCIPCAFLAGFLISFIVRSWIYRGLIEDSLLDFLPDYIVQIIVAFLASIVIGGAMTLIAAKVAPSGQNVVGLCFTSLLAVLAVAVIVSAILKGTYIIIVPVVGTMVGAIIINIYLHEKEE